MSIEHDPEHGHDKRKYELPSSSSIPNGHDFNVDYYFNTHMQQAEK
jgi:hypothetical protein